MGTLGYMTCYSNNKHTYNIRFILHWSGSYFSYTNLISTKDISRHSLAFKSRSKVELSLFATSVLHITKNWNFTLKTKITMNINNGLMALQPKIKTNYKNKSHKNLRPIQNPFITWNIKTIHHMNSIMCPLI